MAQRAGSKATHARDVVCRDGPVECADEDGAGSGHHRVTRAPDATRDGEVMSTTTASTVFTGASVVGPTSTT